MRGIIRGLRGVAGSELGFGKGCTDVPSVRTWARCPCHNKRRVAEDDYEYEHEREYAMGCAVG